MASDLQELRRADKRQRNSDSEPHELRNSHATIQSAKTVARQFQNVLDLIDEILEDAKQDNCKTSLNKKLKSSKVVPLLDEYEAELRTARDELRSERQAADTLAGLLRDTTRALLEAPDESVKMVMKRLPHTFGKVLTQWAKEAQDDDIDVDTVFEKPPKKKIRLSYNELMVAQGT